MAFHIQAKMSCLNGRRLEHSPATGGEPDQLDASSPPGAAVRAAEARAGRSYSCGGALIDQQDEGRHPGQAARPPRALLRIQLSPSLTHCRASPATRLAAATRPGSAVMHDIVEDGPGFWMNAVAVPCWVAGAGPSRGGLCRLPWPGRRRRALQAAIHPQIAAAP